MRLFRLLSTLILSVLSAAATTSAGTTAGHGELPMFFIPNQGQAAGVRYMAKGSGVTAYFFDGEVAFRASDVPVRMRLLGAEPGFALRVGAHSLVLLISFPEPPSIGVPGFESIRNSAIKDSTRA